MKESELFQHALADPVFRQKKIEDLNYHKNVCLAGIVICLVLYLACSLYGGLALKNWLFGEKFLFLAAFVSGPYSVCRTRIAALETLATLNS